MPSGNLGRAYEVGEGVPRDQTHAAPRPAELPPRRTRCCMCGGASPTLWCGLGEARLAADLGRRRQGRYRSPLKDRRRGDPRAQVDHPFEFRRLGVFHFRPPGRRYHLVTAVGNRRVIICEWFGAGRAGPVESPSGSARRARRWTSGIKPIDSPFLFCSHDSKWGVQTCPYRSVRPSPKPIPLPCLRLRWTKPLRLAEETCARRCAPHSSQMRTWSLRSSD